MYVPIPLYPDGDWIVLNTVEASSFFTWMLASVLVNAAGMASDMPVLLLVRATVPPVAVVIGEAVSAVTGAEAVQPVVVKVLSVPIVSLDDESMDLAL